jgi:hypothetical protein
MSVSVLAFFTGLGVGLLFGSMVVEWIYDRKLREWATGRTFRRWGKLWQMRKGLHVIREQDPS